MNINVSDFLADASATVAETFNTIVDKLKLWVQDAANWIKHYFQIFWQNCVSLYQSLRNWLKDAFADKNNNKINLFDPKSPVGEELIRILDGANTMPKNDFFKYGDTLAVSRGSDGEIRDITSFKADCGMTSDMQRLFDENNGQIAIENI